jgi:hypothetical protein
MADAKKPRQKLKLKHYFLIAAVVLAGIAFLRARHPEQMGVAQRQDVASPGQVAQNQEKDVERLRKRLDRQMKETGESGLDVSASAHRVYAEYQGNEVSADSKYKGKWVEIKGRVSSVSKDFTGDPYLTFAGDEYGAAMVNAELFPVQIKEFRGQNDFIACSATEKAGALRAGQIVTVECRGAGSVVGMPRFEQCVITDAIRAKSK